MSVGFKASFEMGSSLFSSKISTFLFIFVFIFTVFHKVSALLQSSTSLLLISDLSDSEVMQNSSKFAN